MNAASGDLHRHIYELEYLATAEVDAAGLKYTEVNREIRSAMEEW